MMRYETKPHPFVTYLESIREDRAALASLRRGLGQPPGTVPEMYRYVASRLPNYVYPGSWRESVYYLVASLYALHPESTDVGNLGAHFALTLDPKNPDYNVAVERRFSALLTAHPEDLPFYLRQAISFLKSNKSKEIAINWHQLMWDLLLWNDPEKAPKIQKRWAYQFWRKPFDNADAEVG